jgi:hypothetical protein
MAPNLDTKKGTFHPVLKRSFVETFTTSRAHLLTRSELTACYLKHQQNVLDYFEGREAFISINLSDANSLPNLFTFLGIPFVKGELFPHLNKGTQVANWKKYKHPNKINSLSSGKTHRRFFDYKSGTCNLQ